ncbi:MAG: hypothetical protein GX124_03635 [Clostridiales bacterium]|jgi:hypothetical protein|nr:hypothetical protein [Clostridiales bacterium]
MNRMAFGRLIDNPAQKTQGPTERLEQGVNLTNTPAQHGCKTFGGRRAGIGVNCQTDHQGQPQSASNNKPTRQSHREMRKEAL